MTTLRKFLHLGIDPLLYAMMGGLGFVCASEYPNHNVKFWCGMSLAAITALKAKRSAGETPVKELPKP